MISSCSCLLIIPNIRLVWLIIWYLVLIDPDIKYRLHSVCGLTILFGDYFYFGMYSVNAFRSASHTRTSSVSIFCSVQVYQESGLMSHAVYSHVFSDISICMTLTYLIYMFFSTFYHFFCFCFSLIYSHSCKKIII